MYKDNNGSGERQLTFGKGVDMYPEWSGDGQSIYYTSNKHGGTLELYRVNTTGDPKATQLSLFGKEVRSLSVSADNSMIAMGIMSDSVPFGADLKPYSADLYVIKMEKLQSVLNENRLLTLDDLTMLLSDPQEKHIWYEQPCFQKTDTKNPYIAYARTENYDNDAISKDSIWVIRADGSDKKLVTEESSMPQWSLNDKYIVTHEFKLIDPNMNEVKQLKIDGLSPDAGSASISPDGKYVIFETSDNNRKAGIAKVILRDSQIANPIMNFSKLDAYEPRWSPVPVEEKEILTTVLSKTIANDNYVTYKNLKDIKSTNELSGDAKKYYTKYIEYLSPKGKSIKILAQDKISDEQVLHAYSVLELYLKNLTQVYGESIANLLGESGNYLVMPNGEDDGSAGHTIIGQPQYQLETANIGSKWYIENDYEHRDSTFEEIFHFVHDSGIGNVSKERGSKKLAHMINDGKNNALPQNKKEWGNKGLWEAADTTALFGEYLGKTRESLKTVDPKGLEIVESFLPEQMNVMMRVDSSFEGTFKMYLDEKEKYTYKSQYLDLLTLTGDKSSGIIANANDNILIGNKGDNKIDGNNRLINIEVLRFQDKDVQLHQ